jgi:two-component system nitrogen regulation sensor histidine kinase GlnL
MMTLTHKQAELLLENIFTAVLVFDRALTFSCMNTAAENLLSLSARQLAGHDLRQLFPEAAGLVEMIERTARTRTPYTERGMELDLGPGRALLVDAVVTPVAEEAGGDVIVELIDVQSAVRARREESLTVLHEAARRSLQGMAHEIKNPLGGLRGAAQLLERELNDSALVEYTQIIINEADRLRNLIDQMLAPNGRRRPELLNIHEVVEYVRGVVQAEALPGPRIDRDYDPSLPPLRADRGQLIQALLNVVRNAVQAAGPGGHVALQTRIRRHSTIRQRLYKLALQIDVIDNGPGVPPELESQIFYPMVTGRADGMGLGLSIAQSLLQAHGGSIEYSREDGHTVFRLLLPLAPGEA